MKNMTLKTLGIMVLTATMLASTVTGCGDKETSEGQATEVVEAAAETEAVVPETEVVEEAAEEIVMEDTETTEATETEVAQEELAFHVTDMSATKYAKQKVNVRSGASTDYEQIGSLNANQKVTVTGQADTGWYRIEFNGKEGYVSNSLLVDQKVVVNTPAQTTPTQNQSTGTTTDNTQNQTQQTQTPVVDNSGWTGDTSTSTPSTSTPSTDTSAPSTDNSTPSVEDALTDLGFEMGTFDPSQNPEVEGMGGGIF